MARGQGPGLVTPEQASIWGKRHCLDSCTAKLNPNKERGSTFIWEVDNFDEKWTPGRKKRGNIPPGVRTPRSPHQSCRLTAPPPSALSVPHPASSAQARRLAELGPTPLSTQRRSPGESAKCARVPRVAPRRAWRLQGRRGNRGVPISVSLRPAQKPGQPRRWRERAASAPPKRGQRDHGLRAPPLLHRWLRVPLSSAWLGPGVWARLAAFPSSSVAASRRQFLQARRVRSSFSGFTDFRGRRILPRSLRASLSLSPPPLATPHPVGARAHTHSHSQARVRTPARPEPRSLQLRSADPCSLGRRYSHRLPAATGRPLSAAAATAAAEGTAAAARPRLAAPCPGQSLGEAEKGEDAEARRSRAAPGARLRAAGCLRSSYRGPRLSPSRPASLLLLASADSAPVRAGNFPLCLVCARYYCCYL
ncbi:uncharacterized protein LOC123649077 [Lemur catta]|uniref:uncharacterized protein LOC123649077 n=1 Tax=Lemur catta TaxID=9447 RepID=UPI001E26750C|nr:uncharacterized protein LOC123649077 [Lemur catta]